MKTKTEVSAGGIVYKKVENKTMWLVGQHSAHKGWIFPKGLIGDTEKNESMEAAALREVKEEGGIKTRIVNRKPISVNYSYKWENTLINKTVYYFLMEYVSGDPKNHDWEMSDAKFISEEEVSKLLTYSSDKEAFIAILKLL